MSELLLLPRPRRLERLAGAGPARGAEPVSHENRALGAEAFTLTLDSRGIAIEHGGAAGERYARAALAQIAQQSGDALPALRIEDAPDFAVRGYLLDISRDRVPTRETLARIVELMALLRLNHLQLYTEHTFAYAAHERVWRDASPMTPEDTRWLDALCRTHGIELCANQNTFGHMGRWLAHREYRARAERPDGFATRFGMKLPAGCLAPTQDNADFALALCRELLSHHASSRIHVNCDETFELGRGASAADAAARGKARVYLEHLLRIAQPLIAEGREVLFWGDTLREHPELVRELPRAGLTACVWHYERPLEALPFPPALLPILAEFGIGERALRGFGAQCEAFADSGFPFWVCPGTSTWNSLLGRWSNARENLRDAAEVGRSRGARGFLVTDWGDNGHLQPPSASWLPLAYGAALAWCADANRELAMAPLLDAFVFRDASRTLGALAVDLAETYQGTGKHALNSSPLFAEIVQGALLGSFGEIDAARLEATIAQLGRAIAALAQTRSEAADGAQTARELAVAARLARHGAWRLARGARLPCPSDAELSRDLGEAIAEQRSAWLARSRPGGLADSLARLERTRATYQH
ncbi:MAG: family 20 glycosylhydrolase [Deltaproteobacteria bacterium]|nr:family 20 glycosylhydrolase [Deltaproteobacteria bacterium]